VNLRTQTVAADGVMIGEIGDSLLSVDQARP
jgi:hypothetical protein